MDFLLERSNQALNVNPPTGDTHALSVHGSDWLWAVTAVYILTLLAFVALTFFARDGEKIFHYLFTISLLTGSIAYFTMASDLGSTPVHVSENSPGYREIFYARYINWFVGWTPLVIAIGLLSGVSWATIVFNVALTWTWVATWLAGALTATNYKWGFFAFGTFAYILLAVSLLTPSPLHRHYRPVSFFLVFLWLLYPIAWGLDDGGNKITVTHGFVFFGILDLLTVPLLAVAFLFLARGWDYADLGVYYTRYGRTGRDGGLTGKRGATHTGAVV